VMEHAIRRIRILGVGSTGRVRAGQERPGLRPRRRGPAAPLIRPWAENDAVVGAAWIALRAINVRDELQVTGTP
jgi:hypothetical protein